MYCASSCLVRILPSVLLILLCTLYVCAAGIEKTFMSWHFFYLFSQFRSLRFLFFIENFLAQYFKWIPLSRISPNNTLNITPSSNTNIKYSIHLIFFNAMLKNVYIWHRVHSISLPLMEVHNIRHSQ